MFITIYILGAISTLVSVVLADPLANKEERLIDGVQVVFREEPLATTGGVLFWPAVVGLMIFQLVEELMDGSLKP